MRERERERERVIKKLKPPKKSAVLTYWEMLFFCVGIIVMNVLFDCKDNSLG
jgi:hypothetical protein